MLDKQVVLIANDTELKRTLLNGIITRFLDDQITTIEALEAGADSAVSIHFSNREYRNEIEDFLALLKST